MNKHELYFRVSGTECEHSFIEEIVRNIARKYNAEVQYYRKFKNGHIPMKRECKIIAHENMGHIKKDIVDELNTLIPRCEYEEHQRFNYHCPLTLLD